MDKLLKLLLLLSLTGCSGSATFENDLLNPFKENTDKFYTHGTHFSYNQETEKEKKTYGIGQTIYTPSSKRPDADVETLRKDRPYTGWLYGEYRNTVYTDENTKDTLGIQLGCAGPCSFAKQTQRQFHRIIGQGIPTWDRNFSLKSEPGVVLEAERSHRLWSNNYSDLAAYGSGKLGNIIDNAAFGFDGRIGYNLDRFTPDPIIFKLPLEERKKPWTAYLFARVEERYVLYNHFLSGSLWQNERHTVSEEPFVTEGDIGFSVKHNNLQLTYRITAFSSEWKERKGPFSFGSLNVTW